MASIAEATELEAASASDIRMRIKSRPLIPQRERIDSISCRSTLAMSSGETTNLARSSVVSVRDGMFGSCGGGPAAGAAVVPPERVPVAGPLVAELVPADCAWERRVGRRRRVE
eukprot:6212857-Pleurochrysis_carterae.AAC.2